MKNKKNGFENNPLYGTDDGITVMSGLSIYSWYKVRHNQQGPGGIHSQGGSTQWPPRV